MSQNRHPEHLLAQPGMQLLLAVVGGMLLGWPVIRIAGEQGHWVLYLFVFTVWASLIVLLALIGRAITRSAHTDDSVSDPGVN